MSLVLSLKLLTKLYYPSMVDAMTLTVDLGSGAQLIAPAGQSLPVTDQGCDPKDDGRTGCGWSYWLNIGA